MAMQGVISLKNVVHETLWLANKDEEHYKRFLQLALNGYRELSRFHIAEGIKTVRLIPDENFVVELPDDFIQWLRVSVAYNGQKYSLSERNDMINTVTLSDGFENRDVYGEGEPIGVGGNRMPGGIENIYGYFTIDYNDRRILLLMDKLRPIYLDYVSMGIDSDNDFIPVIAKDALQAYIMWKDAYFDRKATISDRALKKQVYDEEVSKLRSSYSFTLDSLRDALNGI